MSVFDEIFDGCIGLGRGAMDECSANIPEQQGHAPVKPRPSRRIPSCCIKRNEENHADDNSQRTKSVEIDPNAHPAKPTQGTPLSGEKRRGERNYLRAVAKTRSNSLHGQPIVDMESICVKAKN